MHHRMPTRLLLALDMESQKVEAVVDVGDARLRVREGEVEFVGQELTDLFLDGSDFGDAAVADDDEIIGLCRVSGYADRGG
jgi:hypothetical protein